MPSYHPLLLAVLTSWVKRAMLTVGIYEDSLKG